MSSVKEEVRWLPGAAPPPLSEAARLLAAALLVTASRSLARLASALVPMAKAPRMDPRVEFYAEAGAPEGALFVDGEFVGWLDGVRRL